MTRVVLHPWFPPEVDTALKAVPGISLHVAADQDDVAAAMQDGAEVLVTSFWRDDYLTPSLKWIAGTGAGTEQYPKDLLAEQSVVLTTAHGVHASCVAEHAFALLLGTVRHIGAAVRDMVQHEWTPRVGEELAGKNMLVVGLGLIGEEVARRASAWDMEVRGIKRQPAAYSGSVAHVVGPDELHPMLEWADVVVVAAPSTPQTRGVIGAKELELLGSGWLVNVGRGDLVDTGALLEALTEGDLRGAGLDVTWPEPLPTDSPLWDLPQVVLSAHMAGNSPSFGPRWAKIFESNLEAFRGSSSQWTNRFDLGGAK